MSAKLIAIKINLEMKKMKPKKPKTQGQLNKKAAQGNQKQKPSFKQKFKPRQQKKTDNKPNKAEMRKVIRQQKAAEEEAERSRIKTEKEARIKAYKKQRLEKTKAISKRTQRGQPLMKDRMQLLLKQIEEMKRN
ncbi:thyroid transcription factor 1-associated protein 26 isoform X2 [Drosophila grimshawi]|uniref:thyroid transcription factor 1-associated protein 26 isoform X2 n=1 Tax=Drosophila grimshawi TaxID=7222 RepID=UPI000C86EA79|nr:thyroid transcription factor 1-associated protein 26 isoform X2 [Drosophila grimshawi]